LREPAPWARGIAQTAALAGCDVLLLDVQPAQLVKARQAIADSLARMVKKGTLPQEQADSVQTRIRFTHEFSAASDAELIIEAVFELESVKREVWQRLDTIISRTRFAAPTRPAFRSPNLRQRCGDRKISSGCIFSIRFR